MQDESSLTAESGVLLKARGISKSFPGVRALHHAQITVRRGRLNALLGENGAGKSTLMSILSGVFLPDAGEIVFDGRPVKFWKPHDAQQAGISTIYQELNLVPNLSVAENIFLGREPRSWLGFVDFKTMHSHARELLAMLGVNIDPATRVSQLRVGAQQVVEIAKAIAFDARVIIMDEPTSALSRQEVDSLFQFIQQLKQRGVGIIYITHKLDELSEIADEVTVLRDGEFIAEKPFKDVSHAEIIRMMVGRDVAESSRVPSKLDKVVLHVCNVSLPHADRAGDFAVRDVSFDVHSGEIIGIFGLLGAGRTELLQTIFGLHGQSSSGEIFVAGKPMSILSPAAAIRAGIAMAPEDRKAEGLVLPMSIAENISLSCLKLASRLGLVRPDSERSLAESFISRLGVKTSSVTQSVQNLSGGNQQKVVLSKWLATKPTVLLLDEPTRGIDVSAKREIYTVIDELARGGLGIVVASSEIPELLAIADRILVLAEGCVTAEFARGDATEEKLLTAALPRRRPEKAGAA
jgi:ribose transport system ATP-binding protein